MIALTRRNPFLCFHQLAHMLRTCIVILVSVEGLPGSQKSWILRTKHSWQRAWLKGIARQRVKLVVLFIRTDYLGRVRVIVNCFDLVDLSQKLRIWNLRSHKARNQNKQTEQKSFHGRYTRTRSSLNYLADLLKEIVLLVAARICLEHRLRIAQ